MITILESFTEIITSYDIRRYRRISSAYEFVAVVYFKNNTTLHVRDYVFLDGSRKYAFHWQDQNLIRRWDNAEHHAHLPTFPFHVHTSSSLENSPPMTLAKVLEYVKTMIDTN